MNETQLRDVTEALQVGMTAGELLEALQGIVDDCGADTPVVFACNYGDYHNTQQALPVRSVDEFVFSDFCCSAYSHSGIAVVRDGDDEYEDNDGDDECLSPVVLLK